MSFLKLNSPKTTEAYWQQLLSERDSSAKLHQKEYADKTRGANTENRGGRQSAIEADT